MSKAAEAFRTISEVADELGVPKHVLRFWEVKFGQIRPMKRGGGRRYYRPEDLELLRGVRNLLHRDGYTIKGVQKILREQGVDGVKALGSGTLPDAAAQSAASQSKPVEAQPTRTGARKSGKGVRPAVALPQLDAAARAAVKTAIAELEGCRTLLSGLAGRAEPVVKRKTAR